jgi:single-strand DNA-binding protein
MSLNKILLIGNVGQVAQIRQVGDSKVAQFTLATSESRKGKDGNLIQETEWHNISVWGKQAEVVEKYVEKGTQLYIEGRIKTEKYTAKDGTEKYMTRIIASALQLLGKKENSAPDPAPQQRFDPHAVKTTPMQVTDDVDDSDLPF